MIVQACVFVLLASETALLAQRVLGRGPVDAAPWAAGGTTLAVIGVVAIGLGVGRSSAIVAGSLVGVAVGWATRRAGHATPA